MDFHTKCTLPTEPARFVSSPDTRGTLDIFWSCLLTIIACTWSIQHLNLPEQRSNHHLGWKREIIWSLKGFWSNAKWMIATMIAPEYVLGKALGDFVAAREYKRLMRAFAENDNVEWNLVHGFFANMGGFVLPPAQEPLMETIEDESQAPNRAATNLDPAAPATLEEGSQVRNIDHANGDITPSAVQQQSPTNFTENRAIHLIAHDLYSLRHRGILRKLPNITSSEINDKSKGDVFVKSVAVVQVIWVMLQVIVRAAKKLDVSQLELATTAFSVCAIITYCLLFHKPKGVEVAVVLTDCDRAAALQYLNRTDRHGLRRDRIIRFMPDFFGLKTKVVLTPRVGRISNDAMENELQVIGVIIGGVVFGSIHVAGWSLTFPTEVEKVFWRVASIVLTALLPVIFIPAGMKLYMGDSGTWSFTRRWGTCLGLLYVTARLFTLIEIFRSLGFRPPSAYISTWATNVPHVT